MEKGKREDCRKGCSRLTRVIRISLWEDKCRAASKPVRVSLWIMVTWAWFYLTYDTIKGYLSYPVNIKELSQCLHLIISVLKGSFLHRSFYTVHAHPTPLHKAERPDALWVLVTNTNDRVTEIKQLPAFKWVLTRSDHLCAQVVRVSF